MQLLISMAMFIFHSIVYLVYFTNQHPSLIFFRRFDFSDGLSKSKASIYPKLKAKEKKAFNNDSRPGNTCRDFFVNQSVKFLAHNIEI